MGGGGGLGRVRNGLEIAVTFVDADEDRYPYKYSLVSSWIGVGKHTKAGDPMGLAHQGRGRRSESGSPRAKHVIAWVTAVFFCLPLLRFYSMIELDPAYCWEHVHSQDAVLHSGEEHSHSGEVHSHSAEVASPDDDSGFYFRHCKDSYDRMGLTPVQTLGAPVTVSCRQPDTSLRSLPLEVLRPLQADIPTPFHPPRQRS